MDKETIGVKSIKIAIGKRELELTVPEAQKLYQALEAFFGPKTPTTIPWTFPNTFPVNPPIVTYTSSGTAAGNPTEVFPISLKG